MKTRLADIGGEPLAGSPADFGRLIVEETEKWARVILCQEGAKASCCTRDEGRSFLRQDKSRKGERCDLKPFLAIQRVQLPPGKG
jgi:hypothetical protein